MIKKLLLKWLFFTYRKDYYLPVSEIEVNLLMKKLANDPDLRRIPAYLNQCADTARNQYLYSNDEIFKGTVLAFISLREQIIKKKVVKKKELTQDEKNAIMKKRGY